MGRWRRPSDSTRNPQACACSIRWYGKLFRPHVPASIRTESFEYWNWVQVRVRHKAPDGDVASEQTFALAAAAHYPTFADANADFRFAVTLWNRAQKRKGTAAAREAIQWLEGVSRSIKVGASA